ncbi:MAG: UDP-N-acetylmuramoyl-L-alanine--D-glutamate ligase [Lentisphaeria bacterium]|nr:UDP-N-acetylmuramoyl-L-alanine--D-glutamate ligase [Lentisphaeria bacterium]
MKILILGGGVSGIAAKRLADLLGFENEVVSDKDGKVIDFADVELLVVSPGVGETSPILQAALKLEIEVISELEFGFRHLPKAVQLLSITGTNGKTTTTELTTHILQGLGKNACFAGNIGLPLSDVAADLIEGKIAENLVVAVEVSSFQLERVRDYSSQAAVILNVESDHLNRYHGSFELYRQTKLKIFDGVADKQNCFWGFTSPDYREKLISVKNDEIFYCGNKLFNYSELKIKGEHNLENLVAALELTASVCLPKEMTSQELKNLVKSFNSGRHRLENVENSLGITVINDSKATNSASTIAAIKSVAEEGKCNIRLILGGLDKDMDFSPLRDYMKFVKKSYLIGEAQNKFYQLLSDIVDCEKFSDFEVMVKTIKQESNSTDIILFSPACASMDMFLNYKDRGDRFIALIQAE